MNITFDELREIKHSLPHGSIAKIAEELQLEEQYVRNYFGGTDFSGGEIVPMQKEPGPHGGIIHIEDTTIFDKAQEILSQTHSD